MLPLIPLISLLSMACGGTTLWWYDQLNSKQQEEANGIASNLAKSVFQKPLDQLVPTQARHVLALTQRYFGN